MRTISMHGWMIIGMIAVAVVLLGLFVKVLVQ